MILSSEILSRFQRCPRQYAIEREYRVLRWRPKVLLETLLRQAILQMSSGADHKGIAEEACARLLETAARPGLDVLGDPYTLARDYCAIIQTVLEAVSRLVLLTIQPGPLLTVGENQWQVSAFRDESGVLHRWTCVDRWDEDAQYREVHNWPVFGDCAAARSGMTLHVIEIGSARRGHQHTPWARAYRHPAIMGKYRFRKVDGTPLQGDWKPVWFQDSDKNDAKVWVDLLEADNINLIHHVTIKDPHKDHIAQFEREVAIEAGRMQSVGAWQDEPMRRGSCDIPYICPHQPACFAPPGLVSIPALGYAQLR